MLSAQLQRAQMLLSQGRTELAENEIRQSLAQQPDDGLAHALLAICLVEREQLHEATEEAEQAIHLAPGAAFSHYVMGHVMYHRNRFDEAASSVTQAIRFDPYDASFHALSSAIAIQQRDWTAALAAAERGLEVEPDHVRCMNLRGMALTNLGRTEEAGQSIELALQDDPDNAYSHANQGWTLLHAGQPKKALEHFREALRLDPNSEFARAGVVEAMKAHNPIYRWLLAWFLWLSTLNPKVQIALILGLVFGQRILVSLVASVPSLESMVPFIVLAYVGFVWMSWCAPVLFNLVLRFDRFGRLALSSKERHQSSIVGLYLVVAVGWIAAGIMTGNIDFYFVALAFALTMIPLNATFYANTPLFLIGMAGLTIAATWYATKAGIDHSPEALKTSITISALSTWASMLFSGLGRPKKI